MKVLILQYGRKGGFTERAVNHFIQGIGETSLQYEAIDLFPLRIGHCDACIQCRSDVCSIDDDMQWIVQRIRSSDALVLACPIYFNNVPSKVKALIDRLHPFWFESLSKQACISYILVAGRRSTNFLGVKEVIKAMSYTMNLRIMDGIEIAGTDDGVDQSTYDGLYLFGTRFEDDLNR